MTACFPRWSRPRPATRAGSPDGTDSFELELGTTVEGDELIAMEDELDGHDLALVLAASRGDDVRGLSGFGGGAERRTSPF